MKYNKLLCKAFIVSLVFTITTSQEYDPEYYYGEFVTVEVPYFDKVKLTVFYESLCTECVSFFYQQLKPAYHQLNTYINLELVPYGNAKQTFIDGHWQFTCQNGQLECEYNILHACTLHLVKQTSKAYKFISCLMSNSKTIHEMYTCAKLYAIQIDPILECSTSSFGEKLLAQLGDKTHDFTPPIKGVPSVAFNDTYTDDNQEEALRNLPKTICRLLNNQPLQCEVINN